MPPTKRLLVAALAFTTLSLSPLESFAGPLQVAVHRVPPDWLTRTNPWLRQARLSMPCGKKILLGLGIGAGAGFGMLMYGKMMDGAGLPPEAFAVPLVTGGMGSAVGYKFCR
jgi:hypothetical protein